MTMAGENKSQLHMVVLRFTLLYQEEGVQESEPYKEPGIWISGESYQEKLSGESYQEKLSGESYQGK